MSRNNNGGVAQGNRIVGAFRAGIRVSGAYGVTVEGNTLDGSTSPGVGIHVDASKVGGGITFAELASKEVVIANNVVIGTKESFFISTYNIEAGDDPMWTDQDVTLIGNRAINAEYYPLYVGGIGGGTLTPNAGYIAGVTVRGFEAVGSTDVILNGKHSRYEGISVTGGGKIILLGGATAISPLSSMPDSDVHCGALRVDGGQVKFQYIRGVSVDSVSAVNAPVDGVLFATASEISIGRAEVKNWARSSYGIGINVLKAQRIHVVEAGLWMDARSSGAFNVSGGDATDVASDIRYDKLTYWNQKNQTGTDVNVEGGTYAAQRVYYDYRFFNGGEASPIWRYKNMAEEFGGIFTVRAPSGAGYLVMDNAAAGFGNCVDFKTEGTLVYEMCRQSDGTFTLYNASTGKYVFRANTALSMMPTAGNVLVGTNTDDGVNRLQVNGGITVTGLPTSCTGKPTGTLWNNSGVVNVCP